MGATALLLRGTEGEPVADPRRTPAMDVFSNGEVTRVQEPQGGSLASVPGLPTPGCGQHGPMDSGRFGRRCARARPHCATSGTHRASGSSIRTTT